MNGRLAIKPGVSKELIRNSEGKEEALQEIEDRLKITGRGKSMGKELRILILEDVPNDAKLMELELRKAGIAFSSKRVDTQKAFLKALKDFLPDLILGDYILLSFDGLAALAIIQEECPDVPFIFVSDTIGEDFAIETLKRGATDYILKNRMSRLAPAVHRALEEIKETATGGQSCLKTARPRSRHFRRFRGRGRCLVRHVGAG